MNVTEPSPTSAPHSDQHGPRRLVRLTDQAKWGGVAAGLGWYFGLDPNLFRVAFVVLGLSTSGLAVIAYILLMILLPKETTGTSGLAAPAPSTARTQGIAALAIIAGVVVLGQLDIFRFDVLAGAALIGVGVLLFNDDNRSLSAPAWLRKATDATAPRADAADAPHPTAGATPPPPRPGQTPTVIGASPRPPAPAEAADHATGSAYETPYAARHQPPPRPPHRRREPRPRSLLTPLTIGVWLLVMGAAAMLSRLGVFELTATLGAGLSLLVLGSGLLIGTRFGRARGLIPLGLLTVVFLTGVTVAQTVGLDLNLSDGVGQRDYRPTSVEEVPASYRLFAGEMTVDLSDLELDGQTVEVVTDVTLGEVRILVPDDVRVIVDSHVQAGDLTVFGEKISGTSLDTDTEMPGPEGDGLIRLDADVRLGELTIEQVPEGATQ